MTKPPKLTTWLMTHKYSPDNVPGAIRERETLQLTMPQTTPEQKDGPGER